MGQVTQVSTRINGLGWVPIKHLVKEVTCLFPDPRFCMDENENENK